MRYTVLFMIILSSCSQKPIESFFEKLNILVIKKNVIKNNIQNINTTRSPEGGVYIPKEATHCKKGICEIKELKQGGVGANTSQPRSPILKYEPNHPDANKTGYVAYPNINLEEEKEKLEQINLAISFLLKEMPVKPRYFFSAKAQSLFQKYPELSRAYNFKALIEE